MPFYTALFSRSRSCGLFMCISFTLTLTNDFPIHYFLWSSWYFFCPWIVYKTLKANNNNNRVWNKVYTLTLYLEWNSRAARVREEGRREFKQRGRVRKHKVASFLSCRSLFHKETQPSPSYRASPERLHRSTEPWNRPLGLERWKSKSFISQWLLLLCFSLDKI